VELSQEGGFADGAGPLGSLSPPLGGPVAGDLSQAGDISHSPLPEILRFNHFTPNPSAPCQPPSSPRVASPVAGDLPQDIEQGDISHSPLPGILRFNHFTPNASAPSPCTQNSEFELNSGNAFAELPPTKQSCISCDKLFTLRRGENCYGKCDDCLELGVRSFIHAHARVLGPISGPVVHDERPPEASTGEGDPMGGSPEPGANSGGGSMNSFFLSLAPDFLLSEVRRCIPTLPRVGMQLSLHVVLFVGVSAVPTAETSTAWW
jgi:hypothetical protein